MEHDATSMGRTGARLLGPIGVGASWHSVATFRARQSKSDAEYTRIAKPGAARSGSATADWLVVRPIDDARNGPGRRSAQSRVDGCHAMPSYGR